MTQSEQGSKDDDVPSTRRAAFAAALDKVRRNDDRQSAAHRGAPA